MAANPRSIPHRIALGAERTWERLRPDPATSYERLTVVPYVSHGNRERLVLRGRVLSDRPLGPTTAVEPLWTRVTRMVRRFTTSEVPDVRLRIDVDGATAEAVTDDEGYWLVEVDGHELPDDRMLHHVTVEPVDARDVPIHTRPAWVMVPTDRARRLVVSDIDDTVMRSGVTDTSQYFRTTVAGSSWTRQAFPGTAELYAGLQRGPRLDEHNPVAYLSSSAWNLYDFLVGFLQRSAMPTGPLFLRDLGVDRQRFIKSGHADHKRARIDELLEVHDLPLVLVGDTGQHDPEIYRGVVGDNPGRVELVLLRDVADEARAAEVRELFADTDVPLTVAPDSAAFAATCEELSLVAPGWTDRVATEV